LPKPDTDLGERGKAIMAKYPVIQASWRKTVASSLNVINFGLRNPAALKPVNLLGKQLLKLQIQDPVLRKNVTPNFLVGCKRILFANNYYPALQAPNTTLTPHGLVKVDGNSVIAANGERHEVDVIIWGTGFEVSHPPIGKRVFNEKGQRLSDLWKDTSPEAYLGTSMENVPNAFLMLGPNVLVYDSFIGLAEAQLDYIVDGLLQMQARQISKLNVKPSVVYEHNQLVQQNLQNTVFNSGGCKSYYLDANGRNFAAWPWSLKKLKQRLSGLNLSDYEVTYATSKTERVAG
jgi:cation diffusion facilitator CzcD-associated flavoprotein CzcO